MSDKDIDEHTGIETTGHEWDGIKELNQPLPRWWLWTFYATIIFSIGYVVYYPAIPLVESSTLGISGQTNRLQLKRDMEAAEESRRDISARLADADLESIRKTDELYRFATAGGKSLYKVYCSQCHGSGAQGASGYPNLNDDDWIWGGDLEAIYATIKHGVRNDEDDDARDSLMPAFGADELLENEEIAQVTEYVLKISEQEHDSAQANAGMETFLENCAACHGENGAGDRELGAPNLTDSISLYGNTRETINAQIQNPNHGVMPAWQTRLADRQIKQLAIYVHGLGGGEEAQSE